MPDQYRALRRGLEPSTGWGIARARAIFLQVARSAARQNAARKTVRVTNLLRCGGERHERGAVRSGVREILSRASGLRALARTSNPAGSAAGSHPRALYAMTKRIILPRNISRRQTLKACIVPATAVLTSRWLGACSAAEGGSTDGNESTIAGSGGSVAGRQSPAANGGTSGATAGSQAQTTSTAGSTANATAGTSGSGSAGTPAANSSGGTGGSTQQAAAGSSAPATGGAPASAGAPATAGSGGAVAQAGAGGAASTVAGPGVMWATGGTAMMAADYPDPFEMGAGTSCRLYPAQTLGPCYADQPMMRQDISDGLDGLPTRVSFLVVEADGCTPIPGATVDIWHSGSQGIYSAYATGTTCNPGDDDVMSDMFCRGVQAADETGRVNFSTVFPGWYRGRTLHIHFTVRMGNNEIVTSQLYFDDALVDEILAQGYYAARGMRDTTNQRDGIFRSGGATAEQVVMEHAKRPDGVLHLWKVLAVG
jgi:protocatechuate 3,4-dioxygenase beta subunit